MNIMETCKVNTNQLKIQIETLKQEAKDKATDLKLSYLGKDGKISEVLHQFKEVDTEEREMLGKLINETVDEINSLFKGV